MDKKMGSGVSRREFVKMGLLAAPCVAMLPKLAQAEVLEGAPVSEVVPEVTHDPAESVANGPTSRSWYRSSLKLGGSTSITSFSGSTRYYGGSNVGIEMTCRNTGGNSCDSHFSVELHRSGGGYVGSAAFSRSGFTKATWSNVGSGYYYFKFVKCRDTQTITSNDVTMYSW